MALTQKERENLAPHLFAVPGKRALPMPDAAHTKMAWSMVDYTKGLSETEKAEAKRNILRRAKDLGLDTAKWEAHQSPRMDMQPAGEHDGGLQAMRFEAMALEVPEVPDHPNRVPFSGVMTRIDQASDNPVGGAQGKRVMIPKAVAEASLPSLLGMGVDYAGGFGGHDAQKKIGVITAATIDGDAIHIEGFLYGSDFPAVVADIQARKSLLGFSYEAQAAVADWKSDPVEVTSCVFTGAAILYKDKAAYTTTSLTAHADTEQLNMDELKELMAAVAKLTEQNTAMAAEVASLKANSDKLQASSVLHKVKPHTDALRAAADGMEKDGMGMHDKRGHVAHLRRMADTMDSEAVMGKVPHIYNDHSWMDAAADKDGDKREIDALKAEIKSLKDAAFNAAAAPTKPTDKADAATKPALQAQGVDIKALDAKLKASNASTSERLRAITLARMGEAA